MKKTLLALAASPAIALAHDGHGMPGPAHWHATDVLGFVATLAAVGVAMWWFGRK